MTKEQEKAIKVLEQYKQECIEEYKVELDDKKNTDEQHASYLRQQIEAVYTVLSMLKEKDADREELKQTLARNITKNFISSMKESAKSKEDLEMLNAGWQIELEKKERQIDLMAEHIVNSAIVDDTVCAIKCDCETDIREECTYEKMLNCTKQYFERKATKLSARKEK